MLRISVINENYFFVFLKMLNQCAFTLTESEFIFIGYVFMWCCALFEKITDS